MEEEEELITARHEDGGNTLVSNLSQTLSSTAASVGPSGETIGELSMPFTTGNNPFGYHITSVQLVMKILVGGTTNPVLSIRADNGGVPSETVLYTFTTSTAITSDIWQLITFTTSDETTLHPNTIYWLYATNTGTVLLAVQNTNSDAEDIESNVGWQIGNERYYRPEGGTWVQRTPGITRMQINGHAAPPVLLSNLGQTDDEAVAAYVNVEQDGAQSFVAGPGLAGFGYRFQGVRVSARPNTFFGQVLVPGEVSVSLHSDASGLPGSRLHTLNMPDDFASTVGFSDYTLSAPAGTVLSGGARYWVVFEVQSHDLVLRTTSSTDEDQTPPPADGWLIDDGRYAHNNNIDEGELGWASKARVIKLAVLGEAEWVTNEADGPDLPGAGHNAHQTNGVVTPGIVSTGHLTPGLDYDHGLTGDYWWLETQRGHSYRIEVKFGASPNTATGGSAWITFIDGDRRGTCCDSDHNRNDGYTVLHFKHDRRQQYLIDVVAFDKLNEGSKTFNGPYTITMTDITGTDKLVSNLYLGTLAKVAETVGSSRQYASSFTTGHNPGGYKLDRIRTHIPDDHSGPVLTLHVDTSFAPGTKACDFRNPTQVSTLYKS